MPKYNFIYANQKSKAFSAPIFKKRLSSQQC